MIQGVDGGDGKGVVEVCGTIGSIKLTQLEGQSGDVEGDELEDED